MLYVASFAVRQANWIILTANVYTDEEKNALKLRYIEIMMNSVSKIDSCVTFAMIETD